MDFRDSKFRLILIVVALGIALVVVVASCGGDDDGGSGTGTGQETPSDQGNKDGENAEDDEGEGQNPDDGEDSEPTILAQVTGEEDITLTVVRAEREEGGFLTVEGTLHNGGADYWRSNAWRGSETELAGNGFSMAGATVTAKVEGKKYLILRDTAGRCLCTIFDLDIEAGKTVSWFAQFPAPDAATAEVDFQIGKMPPATFEIR